MVHSQDGSKEPLAKLWDIENGEIAEYLSMEKNLSMVDEIFRQYLDDDNFAGTYIDTSNNKISGPNNMKIESKNDVHDEILVGDGYIVYDSITEIEKDCTMGFLARDQANVNYIATAGHCLRTEPIDFGLIKIDGDIIPNQNIRNTDSEQYKELLMEDDIALTSNGVHLCLSGLYSHVICGYVKSLNGFTSSGIAFCENIFIVSLFHQFGDSGGPLFSFKQDLIHVSLNGILTGGLRDIDNHINGISGVITMNSIFNIFKNISLVTSTPN
ncbi:hypothetical protein F8M41_019836 [Gigaspora margarita]|uniref:Serine protease n=1 Tax=Gigaspora margarita TaxID=4874 RepID=A0A8H4AJD8_GIGMA|nr:hypothetical protein F8M41_019836 [Gigaspora margarita]